MKLKAFLFISIFFLSIAGFSQDRFISMEEALQKVLQNNASLKIAGKEVELAKSGYKQTDASLLPKVNLSYSGIVTNNPLVAFGSKLNQEAIRASDFSPQAFNDPDRIESYATIIDVEQPIFNLDGIHKRRAAKLQMKIAALQESRRREFILLEAEKAYMQLQLARQAMHISKQAYETAQAHFQIATNLLQEGIIKKVDLLEVEINRSEAQNRKVHAAMNYQNASDYLAFLMQEQMQGQFVPADSLQKEIYLEDSSISISDSRADLKALELTQKVGEENLKANRATYIPRLNAFGSYQLYDDEVFQADANGYFVGAKLSWNLFEGNQRSAKIQQSKTAYEISKLNYLQHKSESEMEMNKVLRRLEQSKLQLQTAELMMRQAAESLEIKSNRFKEGMEKPADLKAAETRYAQKQLHYFQTIYEYNTAIATLKFLNQE